MLINEYGMNMMNMVNVQQVKDKRLNSDGITNNKPAWYWSFNSKTIGNEEHGALLNIEYYYSIIKRERNRLVRRDAFGTDNSKPFGLEQYRSCAIYDRFVTYYVWCLFCHCNIQHQVQTSWIKGLWRNKLVMIISKNNLILMYYFFNNLNFKFILEITKHHMMPWTRMCE